MQPVYTCMIVDDEQDAIDFLSGMISDHTPFLHIVSTANTSEDAIRKYYKALPDLVFMDVEVDELNGFDILNEIFNGKKKSHIIFVTGYNRYAIEAFKTNAIGYLLKPVNPADLCRAVERFSELKELEGQHEKVWNFIREYSGKIRFNTTSGFVLIHPSDILYCVADHNYTSIHTTYTPSEKPVLLSLNLGEVEKIINAGDFIRIHRSILVNSRYLSLVNRRNKTCVLLFRDKEIVLTGSEEMLKKL